MKIFFVLIAFVTVLGCSGDKAYEDLRKSERASSNTSVSIPAAIATSKIIFGGAIGNVNLGNGQVTFLRDQKPILKSFNSFLKKGNIDAGLTRVEMSRVNNKYYLRGYGDEYMSTMYLVKDEEGNLHVAGISCTTKACANNQGCSALANNTCSTCSGDCSKTTTAESN